MISATLAMLLAPAPATLEFSGYKWEVSHSKGEERGPGPNVFDGGPKSVWLDAKGHLHMKVLSESKGYGTYRFTLGSRVDALDPQVVVGLFTWDDAEEDAHRELDVEFARWGDPLRSNGQFVVQPYDALGNLTRFELPPLPRSVHSFDWLPESAAFVSKTPTGKIVAEHIFGHAIPRTGKERAIINFWLYQGKAPQLGKPSELIVEKFEFIPAPAGKRKHTESLSPTG
ncbi:hypothetical protein EON79_05625 [bacterium]|nr:MAG: hypothetical protein EON79_05625 [bacterium]